MVSVSGYLIGSQAAGKMPLPPKAELEWWYQYYFATERGSAGYAQYRREFSKLIWQLASPKWNFDDVTFDRSAASFDNTDHVAHRDSQLSLAARACRGGGEVRRPRKAFGRVSCDRGAHDHHGSDANGAPHPDPAVYAKKFTGPYEFRLITGGIGHNLPQEAPQAFAQAVIDVDG
jgi:pimeloyl-ACP methyl ester carboxylesterase